MTLKENRISYSILLLFIVVFFSGMCVSSCNAQESATPIIPSQKVFVLNSYHGGNLWTESTMEGIKSVFNRNPERVELYIEYLDSNRVEKKGYLRDIYSLYRLKYGGTKIDAIIVTDDEALKFMLDWKDFLFPDVPCIFCGVNDCNLTTNNSDYIGVFENSKLKNTIDIASSLQPEKDNCIVISDRTITGQIFNSTINELIPSYENRLSFTIVDSINMSDLQMMVSSLEDNAFILFLTFNRDKSGKYYENEESLRILSTESKVPIYSIYSCYLGKGIVGGDLTEGFHQGRIAAEMTVRVLNGENITSISPINDPPSRIMFDYEYLEKFYIDERSLPTNSTIINEPLDYIPLDPKIFWAIIIGILLLLLTVATLTINTLKRKHAEAALIESEAKYKDLSERQREALEQIEKNLEHMAILNDHIRNPLTIIVGLADLDGGAIREKIIDQVSVIDSIINKLDQGWLESQKIRDFLQRHYSQKKS